MTTKHLKEYQTSLTLTKYIVATRCQRPNWPFDTWECV